MTDTTTGRTTPGPDGFDAEAMLRGARRPLVIGMGGGGDVVGALATAEHAARYDGSAPVVGGLSWARRPIDPRPGPRTEAEIAGARRLAAGLRDANAALNALGISTELDLEAAAAAAGGEV